MTEQEMLALEKEFFEQTREETAAEKEADAADEGTGGRVVQSRVDRPGRQSSFLGPRGTVAVGGPAE